MRDYFLDDSFFEQEKIKSNIQRDEMLWQAFFERNTWIFGFGLQYVINIPLQNKKLEQVVSGFDVVNKGKRVDACMKSKGIISSLCFAEIKTHRTKLINSEYRPSVYPPSNELSGWNCTNTKNSSNFCRKSCKQNRTYKFER